MQPTTPPPNDSALLSSWKEIAAHLGVSVRTAQNWEAERGLPVRRVPGGRGRVVVYVSELDAWLINAPPVDTAPAPPVPQPRITTRRAVAAGIAAVAGTAAIAWMTRHLWRRPPARWRLEGDALLALDTNGRELWRKTFGCSLIDYKAFGERELGWVGDLNGDGDPELLFAVHPKGPGAPMVYCFDAGGKELWRFEPGTRAANFPERIRPPYFPQNLIVFSNGKELRVAVASVHHTWAPCEIAVVSPDGTVRGDYWHPGHLYFIAAGSLSPGAKPLLFAGGISNADKSAALSVLDPDALTGISSGWSPEFRAAETPAREVARILFPRSCINQAKEDFNGVRTLRLLPGELQVNVYEEIDHPSAVLHTFGADGRYRGAGLSSRFAARHAELESSGLLHHRLDPDREARQLSNLSWTAGSGSILAPG